MTKIAILSDTHDNIANLEKAMAQIRTSGAEVLLHCGDLCAPFMVSRLAQGFAGQPGKAGAQRLIAPWNGEG